MKPPGRQGHEAVHELLRAAQAVGLDLTHAQLGAFITYIDTLLLWRNRLSLTTAATAAIVVRDHIADSLFLARYVHPGSRLADIGSGAGFPGIPLAIFYPTARITLVESRRKRANFLREVVRRTGLKNVSVVESRAESASAEHDESFDIVTSRALGPLGDFLLLAQRLLKTAGLAIAMKGPKGRAEAAAVAQSTFQGPEIGDYRLADGAQRTLLVFRKLS